MKIKDIDLDSLGREEYLSLLKCLCYYYCSLFGCYPNLEVIPC